MADNSVIQKIIKDISENLAQAVSIVARQIAIVICKDNPEAELSFEYQKAITNILGSNDWLRR